MAQHNDFQFLEVAGAKPKNNQLKHASKRHVADGQEHDASKTKKRRLFYTDRIYAPHRVGLKNQSQSARMICDYSAGYSVQDSDYQNGRIGGSSHNCSSRTAFALILPGETRFFPIRVVPKDLRLGSAHVSVDFLFSSALFPSFGEKHDFQVSWTGTVVEIMNSTERLQ